MNSRRPVNSDVRRRFRVTLDKQMTTGTASEQTPIDPKRVRAFAIFFKRYMNISSLVVASLPIPVTSLGLIPTFSAQTKLLSVYTSLFCFLTLGFIFYSRHQLARLMFPEYFERKPGDLRITRRSRMLKRIWRGFIVLLPLFFIAASLISVFQYNDVLNLNVQEVAKRETRYYLQPDGSHSIQTPDFKHILAVTDLNDIQYSSRLMILYIAIFLTAEAAFIMMAIKEYLQDLVGLAEMDLIRGYSVESVSEAPSNKSLDASGGSASRD
jgi:hypothetical protein